MTDPILKRARAIIEPPLYKHGFVFGEDFVGDLVLAVAAELARLDKLAEHSARRVVDGVSRQKDDRILADINDSIKQATTEHSHYYTASVLLRAYAEIARLREIESRMEDLEK